MTRPNDPIMDQCESFANNFQITITDNERNYILSNCDKLAESPLGGAYVHKDVLHALCFLCLFDSLFEIGVEQLRTGDAHQAGNSLEKAKKLLPWPTVLYSLGTVYAGSGKMEAATKIWKKALDGFELRPSLLSAIVPTSLPDRDNFITMTAKRIDTTGSLFLGITNFADLKGNILKKLETIRS